METLVNKAWQLRRRAYFPIETILNATNGSKRAIAKRRVWENERTGSQMKSLPDKIIERSS